MKQKYAISIDAETCTGCGLCVLSCPVDVIRLDASGLAEARYPADCQVCYLCEDDCPSGSIHLSHDITNSRRYSTYDDPRYKFDWSAAEELSSKGDENEL